MCPAPNVRADPCQSSQPASEHIQPLVSRVLPPDVAGFIAVVDYLPARVSERMHTLEFAWTSPVPVSMVATVEDDNVGFLPQLTAPALHRTVERRREYGIAGYCFRQLDISPHEPTMAYLAEAGWDPAAAPSQEPPPG
jgi:hypothetical protein